MSLIPNKSSLRATIMQPAWEHFDIEFDNPGECEQIFLPSEGLLVVDLDPEGEEDA